MKRTNTLPPNAGTWSLENISWQQAGILLGDLILTVQHPEGDSLLVSLEDFGPLYEEETLVIANNVIYRGCTWMFYANGTATCTLPPGCPTDETVLLSNASTLPTLDLHRTITAGGFLVEIPAPS
jgi:hypothetical protein